VQENFHTYLEIVDTGLQLVHLSVRLTRIYIQTLGAFLSKTVDIFSIVGATWIDLMGQSGE
jgi:hypothetical protein